MKQAALTLIVTVAVAFLAGGYLLVPKGSEAQERDRASELADQALRQVAAFDPALRDSSLTDALGKDPLQRKVEGSQLATGMTQLDLRVKDQLDNAPTRLGPNVTPFLAELSDETLEQLKQRVEDNRTQLDQRVRSNATLLSDADRDAKQGKISTRSWEAPDARAVAQLGLARHHLALATRLRARAGEERARLSGQVTTAVELSLQASVLAARLPTQSIQEAQAAAQQALEEADALQAKRDALAERVATMKAEIQQLSRQRDTAERQAGELSQRATVGGDKAARLALLDQADALRRDVARMDARIDLLLGGTRTLTADGEEPAKIVEKFDARNELVREVIGEGDQLGVLALESHEIPVLEARVSIKRGLAKSLEAVAKSLKQRSDAFTGGRESVQKQLDALTAELLDGMDRVAGLDADALAEEKAADAASDEALAELADAQKNNELERSALKTRRDAAQGDQTRHVALTVSTEHGLAKLVRGMRFVDVAMVKAEVAAGRVLGLEEHVVLLNALEGAKAELASALSGSAKTRMESALKGAEGLKRRLADARGEAISRFTGMALSLVTRLENDLQQDGRNNSSVTATVSKNMAWRTLAMRGLIVSMQAALDPSKAVETMRDGRAMLEDVILGERAEDGARAGSREGSQLVLPIRQLLESFEGLSNLPRVEGPLQYNLDVPAQDEESPEDTDAPTGDEAPKEEPATP